MESLTYNDFSKGVTDNLLAGDPKTCGRLDNLLLDERGSPYTRPGWYCHDSRMQVSVTSQRPSGLYLTSQPFDKPFYFRADKAFFMDESDVWQEILGPELNSAAPNKTTTDLESLVIWNKQLIYVSSPSTALPHRIYCTDYTPTRAFTALTLGLPPLASSPTATAGTVGTTYTYIYALHYYYEFTDYQGTVFVERGPVTFVTATAANAIAAGAGNTISLASIPVLANTTSTNYDVSTSLKTRISRTVNNGSTFYFLADVDNGTTTYADTTEDSTIDDNSTLYTDGGVLDYNQPPAESLFTTQVNSYFWYATERTLTHSIQGAPGACPDEFEQPTDQKVTGLSSWNNFPILFCDQSVYRVEGLFDEFGDGGFEPREIHPTAGCVSNRSIVRIPTGLVWAGNGGFYFTDGYQVQKISKHLEKSYETFKSPYIVGTYDSQKNIVFWTISGGYGPSFTLNDMVAALHLNFGISPESTFTFLKSEHNFYPSCVAYSASEDVDISLRNKLLIGDSRGYLAIQDDNVFADDKINTQVTPSNFKLQSIIYRLESSALSFGDDAIRKYCTQLSAILQNETENSVQFLSRRDDGGAWGSFSEIRKDGAIIWGTTEYPWGETSDAILHSWNSLPIVEGMRHFPRGTLRSLRRQIGLTNSKTYLAKSDTLGTATTSTSGGLKYITLNTAGSRWPDDCEDYEVALGDDSYATAYIVKNRVSDTVIQVIDSGNALPIGAGKEWQMRGYRKHERIFLDSFTVHFAPDSQTMTPSVGSAAYQNA
jgi:hypothetical protein